MTGSPNASDRPYPAVDIIEFFQTRSVLVVAAVTALDAMPAELTRLKAIIGTSSAPRLREQFQTIERLVAGAAIGTDNLLVADPVSAHEPFVMCSVSRQPSGAVDVRTIELDRATLALMDGAAGPAGRPMNKLMTAIEALMAERTEGSIQAAAAAIDAVSAQLRASVSRLSIVKARLDLQQSFLSSVMEAETGAPIVRLESHLSQAGARDMALEARRLLSSTRSLNIASGNRKTLASLFESHAARETADHDERA